MPAAAWAVSSGASLDRLDYSNVSGSSVRLLHGGKGLRDLDNATSMSVGL